MSADNGIYILETADGQYRVSEFQAVDNLYYNKLKPGSDDLCALLVVLQYGDTKYTTRYTTALKVAGHILKKLYICEYGIQLIKSKKTWKQLCIEAQYEAIQTFSYGYDKDFYDTSKLSKIAKGDYLVS